MSKILDTPRLLPFNLLDVNSSGISEEELAIIRESVQQYMNKTYNRFDNIVKKGINNTTVIELENLIHNGMYANTILNRFNVFSAKPNDYSITYNIIKESFLSKENHE